MKKATIKAGDKYNRLTAMEFHHRNKKSQLYWLFKCDCGSEKVIDVSSVKKGVTKSCGCFRREFRRIHGMYKSREFTSWRSIKQRCLNKNNTDYKHYGGRGITICDRWLGKSGFQNFYKDMGDKPKGLTLDRINNERNYEPSNCKWSTSKEQNNNRRDTRMLTFNGKTQTLSQWAEELELRYGTLYNRIFIRKWSVERALENSSVERALTC